MKRVAIELERLTRGAQIGYTALCVWLRIKLPTWADRLRGRPADARDWSASPRTAGEKRGTSDRFVLKYVKP